MIDVFIKNKIARTLVLVAAFTFYSLLSIEYFEYGFVKYFWMAFMFLCGSLLLPKFILELIFRKSVREVIVVPLAVGVCFSLFFSLGVRMLILGIGVGVTFSLALILPEAYAFLVAKRKQAPKK